MCKLMTRLDGLVLDIFFALAIFLLCMAAALFASKAAGQPAPTTAPSFIVGVWYQPASSLPTWKARGINTAIGVETEGGKVTPADYVKTAHANGIYVTGHEDEADARQQVDEPDGAGGVPSNAIGAIYKTWKAIDGRPVLMNLDGWRTQYGSEPDYIKFCQGADWIGFDYYIINRGEGPENIKKLGERIDKLKVWAPGKRILACIECSDQNLRVTDWAKDTTWGPAMAPKMRGPTPDEVQAEIDVCVAHGASGLIYFPQQIGRNSVASDFAYDVVKDDVAARITAINKKWSPAPVLQPPAPAAAPATTQAVPAPSLPIRTRVLCDANLTPLWGWVGSKLLKDSPSHDYMVSLGVEEGQIIYKGSLNGATIWSNGSGGGVTLEPNKINRDIQDWSRQKNNSDPPNLDACRALGLLNRTPALYGATARPHCPIVFDVEFTTVWRISADSSKADKIAYLQTWIDAIKAVKAGAGVDQDVWIYGQVGFVLNTVLGNDLFPDSTLAAKCRELCTLTSATAETAYWWDPDVENLAGRIIGEMGSLETCIRRQCPEFCASKVLFLNPCLQVYWEDNDTPEAKALADHPVPFELWCRQVDWAVGHGYSIWLWPGWADVEPIRAHLLYAAQYGLTPRGEAKGK